MAFPNLYYKRTAATAKACYICSKSTTTVLATINTADFFYTCPVHLTDRGFAVRAPEPEPEPNKPSASPEEIAKVKQEWEEKQRQKGDRAQGNKEDHANGADGAKGGGEKDADAGTISDGGQEKKPATATPAPSEVPAPRPVHERYVLHRNIFALRTADHRRRRQVAQTKDLAPRFPGAPTSALP